MRAGLAVGIGLALVLATVLWWLVDRRPERLAPPVDAPAVARAPADAALFESDAAELPAPVARVVVTGDATSTAREPLDADVRPIRGRLRDGHCGPPITSGVRLELSSRAGPVTEIVEPGSDGSFATTRAFAPGRVRLRVLEARSGEELFEKALTFDPAEPVWTVWAHLGLVIPLELSGVDARTAGKAQVHVVEEGPNGPRSWITLPLRGGEHPFVHYTSLIQQVENATSARIELEIQSPGVPSLRGSAPLGTTHGVHSMVSLAVEVDTHVFGLVADEQGHMLGWARVWLLPVAPAAPLDEQALAQQTSAADETGAFLFTNVAPGPYLLRIHHRGRTIDPRHVLVRRGANDVGTIALGLREAEPQVVSRVASAQTIESSASRDTLRLLAISGDEALPLDRFSFASRVEGRWASGWLTSERNVPLQAERYLVSCAGYQPRFVSDRDFVSSGDARMRVARVALDPGWSASLVFLETEAAPMDGGEMHPSITPPLAGVRVFADGRQVAVSDGDGLAVVSLESAPSQLTFEFAGRNVLAIQHEAGLRFVWMIRE